MTRPVWPSGPGDTRPGPAAPLERTPVCGWLVELKGYGRGKSYEVGYGRVQIGRDPDNQVALKDDQKISGLQAIINYDPRYAKFYLSPAEKTANLTHIKGRGMPLLTPDELLANDVIEMGDTELQFVPFCGSHFDWGNEPDDDPGSG